MNKKLKFGITSFVDTTPEITAKLNISHDERIREVIKEIVLADQVGLDFYGVGEHHRVDYAGSAPEIILAAAATLTKQITLSTAVTVLSSQDPVRVYEQFATLNAIAPNRVEIMAGRGSFTESFPLFGYNLEDYDLLFSEKLDLLLKLRDEEIINWEGKTRTSLHNVKIFPKADKDAITISIAVGGTQNSVIRAAQLGLPIVFAIIGGNPISFKPLFNLYNQIYEQSGHDLTKKSIGVHFHGYVADTTDLAKDQYFIPTAASMNRIGRDRGWSNYTREQFNFSTSPEGAMVLGNSEEVAQKIVYLQEYLGFNRFMMHLPVGTMPHEQVMHAIRLYGNEVVPKVDKLLARQSQK